MGKKSKTKAKGKPKKPKATVPRKKAPGKEEVPLSELKPDKLRRKHRKGSPKHVLVLEADMTETQVRKTMDLGDRSRRLGNCLTAEMQKRVQQMKRTTEYRTAYQAFADASRDLADLADLVEDDPVYKAKDQEKQALWKSVEEIQLRWGVSKKDAISFTQKIHDDYGVPSIFSQSRSTDIWQGVHAVLYRGGDHLHFKKRGDIPEIAAVEPNRGIIFHVENGSLTFSMELPASRKYLNEEFDRRVAKIESVRAAKGEPKLTQKEKDDLRHDMKLHLMEPNRFGVKVKKGDLFAEEELSKLIAFLEDPEAEKKALDEYVRTETYQETFRPCYAALCVQRIRGKNRVFVHITLEGTASPKRRKDGSFRHTLGKGRIAGDHGPQSLVSYSHGRLVMENIGEVNHKSSFASERKECILLRAMDRSRRSMNPQYYNPNGTIKKGRKKWKKSRRYLKLQDEYRDLCRKNAINRKLGNRQIAHRLRARGDKYITEPNNTSQMIAASRKKKKAGKNSGKSRWTSEQRTAAEKKRAVNKSASSQKTQTVPASSSTRTVEPAVELSAQKEPLDSVQTGNKRRHYHSGRKKGGFRFTRSIQHRGTGGLFAEIKKVFESTGGEFHIVPADYAATQYNHCTNSNIKRELNDRFFLLDESDPETEVQRDGHSALNMYCATDDYTKPDQQKCKDEFPFYMEAQKQEIQRLKDEHIDVCNSGIKLKEAQERKKKEEQERQSKEAQESREK